MLGLISVESTILVTPTLSQYIKYRVAQEGAYHIASGISYHIKENPQ
jgi:hypothetical protein